MKVHIKYFGQVAEKTGRQTELIEVSASIDSSAINELLKGKYGLEEITYRISVNQHLLSREVTIQENDEVALLPPFAGG
jgi:molybdopterin synthase sulfur carrier subunit